MQNNHNGVFDGTICRRQTPAPQGFKNVKIPHGESVIMFWSYVLGTIATYLNRHSGESLNLDEISRDHRDP
ncbi:MAG: hypothetical protein AAF556_01355 [Pseudomonadota bacterium]